MQSNFSENSDRSSFDGSTNQLERMADELMPRCLLKKHKILGIHERRVARKFLLVCGLTYLRQNFPMF
jgi:hypothetical protein